MRRRTASYGSEVSVLAGHCSSHQTKASPYRDSEKVRLEYVRPMASDSAPYSASRGGLAKILCSSNYVTPSASDHCLVDSYKTTVISLA